MAINHCDTLIHNINFYKLTYTEYICNMEDGIWWMETDIIKNIIILGLEMTEGNDARLKQCLEHFIEGTTGVKVQINEAGETGTKM